MTFLQDTDEHENLHEKGNPKKVKYFKMYLFL